MNLIFVSTHFILSLFSLSLHIYRDIYLSLSFGITLKGGSERNPTFSKRKFRFTGNESWQLDSSIHFFNFLLLLHLSIQSPYEKYSPSKLFLSFQLFFFFILHKERNLYKKSFRTQKVHSEKKLLQRISLFLLLCFRFRLLELVSSSLSLGDKWKSKKGSKYRAILYVYKVIHSQSTWKQRPKMFWTELKEEEEEENEKLVLGFDIWLSWITSILSPPLLPLPDFGTYQNTDRINIMPPSDSKWTLLKPPSILYVGIKIDGIFLRNLFFFEGKMNRIFMFSQLFTSSSSIFLICFPISALQRNIYIL